MFRLKSLKFLCLFFIISLGFSSPRVVAQDVENQTVYDSTIENASISRTISTSRRAAVKVSTGSGYGSGSYVTVNRRRIVVTAAHVVDTTNDVTVIGRGGEEVSGSVVYRDPHYDFAIISVPEMTSRRPVRVTRERSAVEDLIGKTVTYTGFPNRHDLLTIKGTISGTLRGFWILQSYAWMGASGSGVFDSSGDLIGVVTGVDVGSSGLGYQIIETIVWVTPMTNINLEEIVENLENI